MSHLWVCRRGRGSWPARGPGPGGGSGGTVCIIGEASEAAEAAVGRLLDEYRRRTGRDPYVVTGSSIGAVEFGVRRVRVLG